MCAGTRSEGARANRDGVRLEVSGRYPDAQRRGLSVNLRCHDSRWHRSDPVVSNVRHQIRATEHQSRSELERPVSRLTSVIRRHPGVEGLQAVRCGCQERLFRRRRARAFRARRMPSDSSISAKVQGTSFSFPCTIQTRSQDQECRARQPAMSFFDDVVPALKRCPDSPARCSRATQVPSPSPGPRNGQRGRPRVTATSGEHPKSLGIFAVSTSTSTAGAGHDRCGGNLFNGYRRDERGTSRSFSLRGRERWRRRLPSRPPTFTPCRRGTTTPIGSPEESARRGWSCADATKPGVTDVALGVDRSFRDIVVSDHSDPLALDRHVQREAARVRYRRRPFRS